MRRAIPALARGLAAAYGAGVRAGELAIIFQLAFDGLQEQRPVLRELHSKRAIKVAGALYDLETATMEFFA